MGTHVAQRCTYALYQLIVINRFPANAAPCIRCNAPSPVGDIGGGCSQRASSDACAAYRFVANQCTSTRAAVRIAHKHEQRAKPGASKQAISIHDLSSVKASVRNPDARPALVSCDQNRTPQKPFDG
jgi:hypothetical protein